MEVVMMIGTEIGIEKEIEKENEVNFDSIHLMLRRPLSRLNIKI